MTEVYPLPSRSGKTKVLLGFELMDIEYASLAINGWYGILFFGHDIELLFALLRKSWVLPGSMYGLSFHRYMLLQLGVYKELGGCLVSGRGGVGVAFDLGTVPKFRRQS